MHQNKELERENIEQMPFPRVCCTIVLKENIFQKPLQRLSTVHIFRKTEDTAPTPSPAPAAPPPSPTSLVRNCIGGNGQRPSAIFILAPQLSLFRSSVCADILWVEHNMRLRKKV